MKKLVLIILLLVLTLTSWAEGTFTLRKLNMSDGLSHYMNKDLLIDKKGCLWVGSWNGINKYDGYSFFNFKSYPTDEIKLNNNRIELLDLNSDNNLWVITYGQQLFLFNQRTHLFENIFGNKKSPEVKSVISLENGISWAVCVNNDLIRIKNNEYSKPDGIQILERTNYSFLGNEIYHIFLDKAGDEWILSNLGITVIGNKKISNNGIPYKFIAEIGGNIYMASSNGLFSKYDKRGRITQVKLPFKMNQISNLFKIDDHSLAILSSDFIFIYNTAKNKIEQLFPPEKGTFIASDKTFIDSRQNLWLFASNNKIVKYNILSKSKSVLNYPDLTGLELTSSGATFFEEDKNGEIWVLLGEGVFCEYNRAQNKLLKAEFKDSDGKSKIYTVSGRGYAIDNQKNLWISTREGIEYLSFQKKKIEIYPNSDGIEARALLYDKAKNFWMGLKNGRVSIYDKNYEFIGNLHPNGTIARDNSLAFGANIYCFMQDNSGKVWLGSRDNGLFILTPRSANSYSIKHYLPGTDKFSINSLSIYSIFQDNKNRVWLGTYGGGLNLVEQTSRDDFRFINASNKLQMFPIEKCDRVRTVFQSKSGKIMVGTTNGLLTFSGDFNSVEDISFYYNFCKSDRSDCLSNNDVMNIYEDSKNNIYISTFSGGVDITQDNPALLSSDIKFRNLNKTNGLASDLSLSVIEDNNHNIWIASANSFSRLNIKTNDIDHFTSENLRYTFLLSEAIPVKTESGELIFSSTKGIIRLLANQIKLKDYVPPIIFTKVNVQNNDNNKSENRFISGDSLELGSNERNISIDFAALDYSNSTVIKYAYRLVDKNESWRNIDKNHSASFVNLRAGYHTFQVKSTNSDGVWQDNVTSLVIYITPTFWETGFAWFLYILVLIALLYMGSLIISRFTNLRKEVKIEHELTDLKLKFFTDISHELRTPLTLISNPIDEVLKNENLSSEGKKFMSIAKSNSDRMLKLINQILDFRKVHNNKMKVYIAKTNISEIADRIHLDFSGIAQQKNIDFIYKTNLSESQFIFTDADKVEKILFNLLSNAFKFTPDHHVVSFEIKLEENTIRFEITDEGSGIEMNALANLFNRFEISRSSDPSYSTGIGLSLVKELINLLQGKIDVSSTKGSGSTFKVELPVDLESFINVNNIELMLEDDENLKNEFYDYEITEHNEKSNTILVVEDNLDLRSFICKILNKEYQVIEAGNGKEALEIIPNTVPDLIISDIMMPEMDGIELLKQIKENHEFSHIPFILLTAKSSLDDQISGIETGADEFITKPFSSTFLKVKINSILQQRKALRDYYLNTESDSRQEWDPSRPKISNFDDQFVRTIISIIEENIEDTEFKIDSIAENIHMSRPVFYRKIKAILGISPIDFVKKIRIKRAIQLIETKNFTIAEVAYQSGFNTPQYLSKVFKEITGKTPSEFVNSKNTDKEPNKFEDLEI